MHIVVVSGSNREGSLSGRLARIVAADYANLVDSVDLLDMTEVGPGFVKPTAYKSPDPEVTVLVERFLASDGAVFIVPEYNGSYPGILKLFVDMLPYPEGFDRRPCAFIGLAAGQFQGLRAVEHFQQVAGYRHAYLFPRRCFIGNSNQQFNEAGALLDPQLERRLREQAEGFVAFVQGIGG